MALSRQTIAELKSEAEMLRQRLAAIDEVLGHAGHGNGGHAARTEIEGGSFREIILGCLKAAGRHVSVREIREHVERSGFRSEAKTSLSTRVSNELYRLRKMKKVERRAGKYAVSKEEQP